jgi:hypothetical protein
MSSSVIYIYVCIIQCITEILITIKVQTQKLSSENPLPYFRTIIYYEYCLLHMCERGCMPKYRAMKLKLIFNIGTRSN